MKGIFGMGQKTFKPTKSHEKGSKRDEMHLKAQATLGSGDMAMAVKLPKGEDMNEWLAVNTVDFYKYISLLYGTIAEFCTAESCPAMSAGDAFQYLWADGVKIKKPIKCSAPEYVDHLMSWVESQLNDEHIFPLQIGAPFPKNFQTQIIPTLFKRLFRVYAHLYHEHFTKMQALGAEAHLNTCFKHFMFFVREFNLIDKKEQEPLKDLIENLVSQ
ncbi:unnamed protein product (mitochondrion) [Plasmodiophora brassicae]|uniref:Uncharacterized protein n=1 Tax=Plasmodiophora brassicae TaxID=37360 RepID=A0A3P3XZX6_PLABS|nr:unnamed protein product [Plasmodiophora brassicae]